MSKNNIIAVLVVVLVVLGVGFLINKQLKENPYSVVYLSTGEVYVGKLTTFPDFQLRNSYILQIMKDPIDATKTNFQLNPISESLWAPEAMHLNRQNVVFYGRLLNTSKIGQTLAAQTAPKK